MYVDHIAKALSDQDHKLREERWNKEAELLLNNATEYFGDVLPQGVDKRAWHHLLIYAPTSVLIRALSTRLFWRLKRRLSSW